VPTVIFVRHGRSSANSTGTLAGWLPGVALDETGRRQADELGARIATAALDVALIASSPLERCRETADRIAAALEPVPRTTHEGLGECRYGAWTGRPLSELVAEPLWKVVQDRPSRARFPDSAAYPGESLVDMQGRALRAVRNLDDEVASQGGPDAVWVAVSHGDVIKSVVSHALGAPLDDFQRIHVEPGSVSVVRYTGRRPFVLRVNDVGGPLSGLVPPRPAGAPEGDAVVGGGTGTVG
jgi:probable phosphomutase (TIGR03848 family)